MRAYLTAAGALVGLSIAVVVATSSPASADGFSYGGGKGGGGASAPSSSNSVTLSNHLRTGFLIAQDTAAITFTPIGLPAVTTSVGASVTFVNAPTTTNGSNMVGIHILAASTYGSIGALTATKRDWQPRVEIPVYITTWNGTPGAGTRELKVGLRTALPSSVSNGDCASSGGAEGAWFCATDWTGATGGGTKWIFCTHNGAGSACLDTGVVVVAGGPTYLRLEFNQTTVKGYVNGVLVSTASSTLPNLTTAIGPFIHAGTFAGLAAWDVNSSGVQVLQNF